MKSSSIITLIVLVVSLFVFGSCENAWFNCIRGNGDVTEELRFVNDFTSIDSEGSFDVFVSIGPVTEIIVEAEENLLDYIDTYTRNDKLTIDTRRNRCIRNTEPIRIYITTQHLKKVELDGSGLIECDNIVGNYFEAELNGSGDIRLSLLVDYLDADISGSGEIAMWGSASETEYKISGSGKIDAFDLICDKSFCTIAGSGNIYVHPVDLLDVKITGSGNVYYLGSPSVHVVITGSGHLIHW